MTVDNIITLIFYMHYKKWHIWLLHVNQTIKSAGYFVVRVNSLPCDLERGGGGIWDFSDSELDRENFLKLFHLVMIGCSHL